MSTRRSFLAPLLFRLFRVMTAAALSPEPPPTIAMSSRLNPVTQLFRNSVSSAESRQMNLSLASLLQDAWKLMWPMGPPNYPLSPITQPLNEARPPLRQGEGVVAACGVLDAADASRRLLLLPLVPSWPRNGLPNAVPLLHLPSFLAEHQVLLVVARLKVTHPCLLDLRSRQAVGLWEDFLGSVATLIAAWRNRPAITRCWALTNSQAKPCEQNPSFMHVVALVAGEVHELHH